jgi:hypothetical protein
MIGGHKCLCISADIEKPAEAGFRVSGGVGWFRWTRARTMSWLAAVRAPRRASLASDATEEFGELRI